MVKRPEDRLATNVISLTSRNDIFQQLEVLKRNREKRTRLRRIFVEGVKAISLALQYKWAFEGLIYCPKRKISRWAEQTIGKAKPKKLYKLSEPLLAELSEKEEPSELIAILNMPDDSIQTLPLKRDGLLVVLDRPQSPGNLGSLIRSADAMKASAVIVSGHAADIYDPQVIRASIGTVFSLPVKRVAAPREIINWTERSGADYQFIGASEDGTERCFECQLKRPLVLVLGNELDGLSKAYNELCTTKIQIPISGAASSLNVSCAGSILLYEILRQELI